MAKVELRCGRHYTRLMRQLLRWAALLVFLGTVMTQAQVRVVPKTEEGASRYLHACVNAVAVVGAEQPARLKQIKGGLTSCTNPLFDLQRFKVGVSAAAVARSEVKLQLSGTWSLLAAGCLLQVIAATVAGCALGLQLRRMLLRRMPLRLLLLLSAACLIEMSTPDDQFRHLLDQCVVPCIALSLWPDDPRPRLKRLIKQLRDQRHRWSTGMPIIPLRWAPVKRLVDSPSSGIR